MECMSFQPRMTQTSLLTPANTRRRLPRHTKPTISYSRLFPSSLPTSSITPTRVFSSTNLGTEESGSRSSSLGNGWVAVCEVDKLNPNNPNLFILPDRDDVIRVENVNNKWVALPHEDGMNDANIQSYGCESDSRIPLQASKKDCFIGFPTIVSEGVLFVWLAENGWEQPLATEPPSIKPTDIIASAYEYPSSDSKAVKEEAPNEKLTDSLSKLSENPFVKGIQQFISSKDFKDLSADFLKQNLINTLGSLSVICLAFLAEKFSVNEILGKFLLVAVLLYLFKSVIEKKNNVK